MPSLGADMEKGTLIEWHVKPGDTVKRGDIVADVETDKGTIEVEIWNDGIVSQTIVEQGQEVPVGTVLALLKSQEEIKEKGDQKPDFVSHELGPARKRRLRVSPLARRIADEKRVDLAKLHGTGPNDAITKSDVERYLEKAAGQPPPRDKEKRTQKNEAMRHAIAETMARSKRDIPHYYLQTETLMSTALRWLEDQNRDRMIAKRILPAALYIKATADACRKIPEMNGFWFDGHFHPSAAVHVGMGISLRHGGLVAPAIHHVEEKTIAEVMDDLLDLVARARAGKLRSSEISDATITITNMGEQGVETVFGVIYPPQVALLGFGKVVEKPVAVNGLIGVQPQLTLTLSADHRASDGHRGGLFLNHIAKFLSQPQMME